jgi:hypothetical protein
MLWISAAVGALLVATVALAQSGLPFREYVRYVSTLTSGGFFPGQLQVDVGDAEDPTMSMWNQNDNAWEEIAGDAADLNVTSVTASGTGTVVTLSVTGTGTIATLNVTGILSWPDPSNLAVVGASQTIVETQGIHGVSAGAAADVTIITPSTSSRPHVLLLVCQDANLTFTDGGPAGAANTIDMAGNLTCSGGDTLSLLFDPTPESGNARWKEVDRSVN